MNVYHWKLLLLSTSIEANYLLYSYKYGLIIIGNKEILNSFNILSFNNKKYDNNTWEWKQGEMNKIKRYHSAAFISDDKIICYDGVSSYNYRCVDVYDFNTNKWTPLKDSNFNKRCSGICYDKYSNTKIFIGWGTENDQKFECYDIIKNLWINLTNTNGEQYRPFFIYMDGK